MLSDHARRRALTLVAVIATVVPLGLPAGASPADVPTDTTEPMTTEQPTINRDALAYADEYGVAYDVAVERLDSQRELDVELTRMETNSEADTPTRRSNTRRPSKR